MGWGSTTGWNSPGWSRTPAAPPSSASFVVGTATQSTNSTSTLVTYDISGAVENDVVAIHFWDDGAGQVVKTLGGGGGAVTLTAQQTGSNNFTYSFTLGAADLASPGTSNRLQITNLTNDKPIIVAIFRGVMVATSKAPLEFNGTGSLPMSGYTPGGGSLGAFTTSIDSGGGSSGPVTATPGSWAFPMQSQTVSGGYYFLTVGTNFTYAGGSFTESGFGTNDIQVAYVWELT